MLEILSRSNSLIVETCKLNQKKYRDIHKEFLVEGHKLINEAIKAGYEVTMLFRSADCKNDFDVKNQILVNNFVIKGLSNNVTPQNCIARVNMLAKKVDYGGNFLVLDRVQEPSNVGAILRSALGANFNKIYLIDCADVYESKALRASMGAVFHLDLVKMSLAQFLEYASQHDLELTICSMEGQNVFETDFHFPVGLVIGNEGQGVSNELRTLSSNLISIPMNNKLESLNASVSAGIIMYAIKNNQGDM